MTAAWWQHHTQLWRHIGAWHHNCAAFQSNRHAKIEGEKYFLSCRLTKWFKHSQFGDKLSRKVLGSSWQSFQADRARWRGRNEVMAKPKVVRSMEECREATAKARAAKAEKFKAKKLERRNCSPSRMVKRKKPVERLSGGTPKRGWSASAAVRCGRKFIPRKSLPPGIFLLKLISKTIALGKLLLAISGQ